MVGVERIKSFSPLFLMAPILALSVGCAKPERIPTYKCHKTRERISVDGRLNESTWIRADEISLRISRDGSPPKFPTKASLIWDEKFLYVAFECSDHDPWATLREHDAKLYLEEVVEIFIDANGDGRTYYEIEVNPLNVFYDVFVMNREGKINLLKDWECEGKKHMVRMDNGVWVCEMALPFSSFPTAPHIPPKSGDVWRINLYRSEALDHSGEEVIREQTAWSPTGNGFHTPSRFGRLIFIGG